MFIEKLNKKQEGVYSIEEEKNVIDGKWEGYLNHDNANQQSISIYTGPKLSGEKINNYFVSTPSETLWKTYLKVFSRSKKIYIAYETKGDQVEADDINKVQNGIVDEIDRAKGVEQVLTGNLNSEISRFKNSENALNNNINQYKESNNAEIQKLKEKDNNLERTKAAKTYVDIELNKRYLKEKVFTKEEVLRKIQDIVGTAPEALDTLQEIAESLNNDNDFAGTMTKQLSKKVDKIEDKQLSTEDFTSTEKQKLAGIQSNANNYIHPFTHSSNMIVENEQKRFVSDDEKNNWNDANRKKHEHSNKSILDIIGQTLIDNWNEAVSHITDKVKHITSNERDKWNTVDSKANKSDIPSKVSQLANDKGYFTKDELGDAGSGDMAKIIYDKNNNGIVDKAEDTDKLEGKRASDFMKKGPLTWNDLKEV